MDEAADTRRELRSAVYRGDGQGALGALSAGAWDDVLQLAGDGFLLALAEKLDGAPELAGTCAAHLAEHLAASLGKTPDLALRHLRVDLEELSDVLEGDGAFGPEGSHDGYGDMEDFIATVTGTGRADRMAIAITGKGAFRRFKDVLERWPEELERWFVFSGERRRGRARAWLAMSEIVAVPPMTTALAPSSTCRPRRTRTSTCGPMRRTWRRSTCPFTRPAGRASTPPAPGHQRSDAHGLG